MAERNEQSPEGTDLGYDFERMFGPDTISAGGPMKGFGVVNHVKGQTVLALLETLKEAGMCRSPHFPTVLAGSLNNP